MNNQYNIVAFAVELFKNLLPDMQTILVGILQHVTNAGRIDVEAGETVCCNPFGNLIVYIGTMPLNSTKAGPCDMSY